MESEKTLKRHKLRNFIARGGWLAGRRHVTPFSTKGLASPSMLPGKKILPYIAPTPASWACPPYFCCVVEGNNIFEVGRLGVSIFCDACFKRAYSKIFIAWTLLTLLGGCLLLQLQWLVHKARVNPPPRTRGRSSNDLVPSSLPINRHNDAVGGPVLSRLPNSTTAVVHANKSVFPEAASPNSIPTVLASPKPRPQHVLGECASTHGRPRSPAGAAGARCGRE